MAGLNFKSATDLFMGTERELALALRAEVEDVRRFRNDPKRAPRELLARLAAVLIERGKGMTRVGEMLAEENSEP